MLSLLNLFQNISTLIYNKYNQLEGTLKYPPETYNMTEESLFLDIGSGFGKPVFHSALQVGCESKGIEVVPARVEFCMDFFYEYIQDKPFFEDIEIGKIVYSSTRSEGNAMKGVDFTNTIYLSELNSTYYEEVIHEKSDIFIELRINQNLIQEDSFIRMLSPRVYKSILFEPNSITQYGQYFINDAVNVPLTATDDHILSILLKLIMLIVNSDSVEDDILGMMIKGPKHISLCELIPQIDNLYILDFLSDINTLFLGSPKQTLQQILKESLEIRKSDSLNKSEIQKSKSKVKDLYKELVKFLENKEKLVNPEKDEILLKEVLTGLKFNITDNWYKKITFVADDATKPKLYANDKGVHFSHIYSYNKLMSKECRKKIAKVLNKTNFKVLAWYSNPKQTIKAGLKDFTLIAKFPMQSTSTEKFHVYVYIKTK
jgi:hypothetical protein